MKFLIKLFGSLFCYIFLLFGLVCLFDSTVHYQINLNVYAGVDSTYIKTLPTLVDHFTYDGQFHKLINMSGVANDGYIIQYHVESDKLADMPWCDSIENVVAINPGIYDIFYRIVSPNQPDIVLETEKVGYVKINKMDVLIEDGDLRAISNSLPYTGEQQTLFQGGADLKTPCNGIIYYGYYYIDSNRKYQSIYCSENIDLIKAIDINKYYLCYMFESTDDFYSSHDWVYTDISISITTIPVTLNVGSLKPVYNRLTYLNKPLQLFNGSPVFEGDGVVCYYAGIPGVDEPTDETIGVMNVNEVQKVDAGTYTLYYRTYNGKNYEDVTWMSTGIKKTIEKGLFVYIDDSTLKPKTDLVYIPDSPQVLFEGAVQPLGLTDGTIVYGLMLPNNSIDPLTITTDLSSIKATTAGTYQLCYQIVGDRNREDTEWIKSVVAKIGTSDNKGLNTIESNKLVHTFDYLFIGACVVVFIILIIIFITIKKRKR